MKILALEFSSPRRSVAVLDGDQILAEQSEAVGESVPPLRLVEQALKAAQVDRKQIGCVAVGLGPGSYSGIRGAIAVAQGWQLAVGVKVTSASSVDCIAERAREEGVLGSVKVVVDAQKSEFYLKSYEISKKEAKKTSELAIITITELKSIIDSGGVLIGPEITRWHAAGRVVFPTGAVLGRLAALKNEFIAGEQLEPIYLRQTTFVKAAPARILPSL